MIVDFMNNIPNPVLTMLLGLIISVAVFRSKNNRNLSIASFVAMIIFVSIAANVPEKEILESAVMIWPYTLSFIVFILGSIAWIFLDLVRSSKKMKSDTKGK